MLMLKRTYESPPVGPWSDYDYDVLDGDRFRRAHWFGRARPKVAVVLDDRARPAKHGRSWLRCKPRTGDGGF